MAACLSNKPNPNPKKQVSCFCGPLPCQKCRFLSSAKGWVAERAREAGTPPALLHRPFRVRRVFPSPMRSLQKTKQKNTWLYQVFKALEEKQPLIVFLQDQSSPEEWFPELFQPWGEGDSFLLDFCLPLENAHCCHPKSSRQRRMHNDF